MVTGSVLPDLNLRHLRAFMAVAECRSISAGAQMLYRAQSAVTRSILELERMVETPLFERRRFGMVPTCFGEALLSRAKRAAAELRQGRVDLQRVCGKASLNESAAIFSMQIGNGRLTTFLGLMDLHSVSGVAHRLGMSQPAVSAGLRELEEDLRVRLFERTPSGLLPTPAASALALRIQRACAELRSAAEEISALKGTKAGHARIGVLALSRTAVIVPCAIARLIRKHPGIRVSMMEGPFATQELALRSGELDFIFGALQDFSMDSSLEGESLLEDRLCVAARASHPLARRRRVTMRALERARWVLNRPGTPGRERLEAAFRARGMGPLQVAVETGSLAMTRALLMESECLTALSPHQIEADLRMGALKILPCDFPETIRGIGIMFRKDSIPSPSASLLASEIRAIVKQQRVGLD